MLKRILFLLPFIYITPCIPQTGGEKIYQFLNTSTNAKQIALGGKTLTLIDDINQAKWNPAILNLANNKNLGINYTRYLSDISIGSISYAHQFSKQTNPIAINTTYLNYGTLIRTNENGKENGTFNASDIAFSIGYNYTIPQSNFHIGGNLRYIYSSIDSYNSSGLSSDLGILFYNKNLPYTITIVGRNIGTQLNTYNGTKESLPLDISFGGSYKIKDIPLTCHFTFDNLQQWNITNVNPSNDTIDFEGNRIEEKITFLDNFLHHTALGLEVFPKRKINLRIGYNFRRGRELKSQNTRNLAGISLGFGLTINRFKLSYAYAKYHTASNTNTFSILANLGKLNKNSTEKLLDRIKTKKKKKKRKQELLDRVNKKK